MVKKYGIYTAYECDDLYFDVIVTELHGAEFIYFAAEYGYHLLTHEGWKVESDICEHCKCKPLKVGDIEIDPCMKEPMAGVRAMCCGHGKIEDAYIQWDTLADDQSMAPEGYPRYEATYGLLAYALIRDHKRKVYKL